MLNSHRSGELRTTDEGSEVTLAGWVHRRRDHGGLIFLDLRDSSGLVQVVASSEHAPDAFAIAEGLRAEFVVQIRGTVQPRPDGTTNDDLPTGAIEVAAAEVVVLNAAETPPFPINQETQIDEETRLRYRYLDLRREKMSANLRLRHDVTKFIRDYLSDREFVEVETPVLGASTPEGARDYLVPSRVHAGHFYALPQSPQQWKQLLVVGGVERYFQIARCYRDEDIRADRQPEFTQLDLEIAFAEPSDIMALMEAMYIEIGATVREGLDLPSPFPVLTYDDAMERYGSDKPDLRYGLEIADLSSVVANSEFQVFRNVIAGGDRVRGIAAPGAAGASRRDTDRLTEIAKEAGAQGLVTFALQGEGALEALTMDDVRSPVARFFDAEAVIELARRCGASRGDMLLVVAADDATTSSALDALRRTVADDNGLTDDNLLKFAWVTDFPMFEWDDSGERLSAMHHMFTAPFAEDMALLDDDPVKVRSHSYDLVCNGFEIGGGSVRIHQRDVQLQIMRALGISEEQAQEQFGHMLDAFTYGAPPHGGIAMGLDRTVALFAGVRDIREVIAFPKTKSATDLLTGAPSPVIARQLAEVHIDLAASAVESLERESEPEPEPEVS
ncbi:MAG TPA: aspartate--tRNA ligase [Dehalococcoidia bacterium]|nr:aspartate--tRNA ligase [Dehalococcoidia bacterium]